MQQGKAKRNPEPRYAKDNGQQKGDKEQDEHVAEDGQNNARDQESQQPHTDHGSLLALDAGKLNESLNMSPEGPCKSQDLRHSALWRLPLVGGRR